MKKFLIVILTILLAISSLALTACFPIEEKAKENLEDAGYTITYYENDYKVFKKVWSQSYGSIDERSYGLTEAIIKANLDTDWVTIYYFDETDDAMDYIDDFESYNTSLSEDDPEYPKRDGRVVYYGTEDAIAVAKGK